MASKKMSQKEEFFQVLNLVATKKVKIRYCRTIKERLRPSTIEESLALPTKPKSPTKRKVEGAEFLTPENLAENLQLRGGVSLLKSYKNRKKIKMKTASPSTAPCTKSLLSYLHHTAKDSDSSSVESDCESSTENGESVRDDFKLKEMSVSMARLSPEKLDRISSRTVSLDSGGEDHKMKGFSDDSVVSTKKNKRNLSDLIINLETEIDDKNEEESSECTLKSRDLSNDNLEVVEDKDVVMQMVEDFSLMSESDSEEDSEEEGRVFVKTEPAEIIDEERPSKAMVWFPGVEEQCSVKKENSVGDSTEQCMKPRSSSTELARSDSVEGQSDFEMNSTHSDSTEETLEEMLQRLEKSSGLKKEGDSVVKKVSFAPVDDCRSDSDSLESSDNNVDNIDNSSHEEFENPALASLVSRMRRESKIEKHKRSRFLLEGSQKCRILEKCDYWIKKEKSPTQKPYDSIILCEAKVGFTRLSRPSRDDVLKARKLLKIEVSCKSEDQGDHDITVDQLEINKPIELVKKKKVKKKRLLEKKRKKRVNGIDEYIRIMLENREKVSCPPDSETLLPTSDSSTFSVDNVVCNDVDVSSEINSTSISRDTLDISLDAETENVASNLEQEEKEALLQDPVTFSITTEKRENEPEEAFNSNHTGVSPESCTNPWEEGVCILEKVEPPKKKNVVCFEMSELTSTEDTLEPDQLEPKDEEVENALGYKKYQCNKCGKEFGTKNGLDYHERTHSGISPFECDVCFKRFKSSSLCSRHKQIHSITKKYNCDVCLKSFAQKSNLSKHMDIHAGIKPYQCPTCPKAFTQKVHLECHIMTHTKDKPWKCLSCATRFSKKSSLIRHSQNVHDMGKDDHEKFILLDEVKFDQSFEEEDEDERKLLDRVRQMRREKKRKREKFQTAIDVGETSEMELQQLNVIPLAVGGDHKSTVLDTFVQNDLNEVNEQFDVEVTYCQDIDILNVPNDTLFIMDSSFEAKAPDESSVDNSEVVVTPISKVKSSDHEQDSEQIEDIQKFLEESKSGTDPASPGDNLVKPVPKHNVGEVEEKQNTKKASLDVPEPSSDKKPKYRIPKSPRKSLSLSKLDKKTPHIPYKKESGLKIISLSENFSRNKVKNDLRSPKKHSFEQALNEALTVSSKKVDRFLERKLVNQSKIVQKPTKPLGNRISQSDETVPKGKPDVVQSLETLGENTFVLSKPKTALSCEFPSPKPAVLKHIIGQQQHLSVQTSLDKKPVIKPLFKPVKPHVLDPKRIKLESTVPRLDTSTHKFQPPPVFSTSQLNSLSQSLKPVSAAASSQDLYNSLKADLFNNSSGLDLYTSAAVRGLPVPVPASSELQSTLTTISAYLNTTTSHPTQAVVEPIKRSESQGYYTSNRTTGLPDSSKPNWVKIETARVNHELTDIESTDVESEDDNPGNPKGQLPTFLPTNFPTFDSPCSSPRSHSGLSSASGMNYGSSLSSFNCSYNPQPSGVSSIKHSGIKPTAVVSPSRPRMPVLPRPVPAAFASSPVRVEKVSVVTAFMCSVCGAEFNSGENLVAHEQTTHWRS